MKGSLYRSVRPPAALAMLAMLAGSAIHLPGAEDALASYVRHLALAEQSAFRGLVWHNVGPLRCGGRVVDIEAYEKRPQTFWVAAASGGVWRTDDGGRNWKALFDRQPTCSIGDIALSTLDEDVAWVGTGEANSQSNSYAGAGVFKTEDGGASWQHMGLAGTRHIARVLVDPLDPNIVFVAALGDLVASSPERGVFRTLDGGKTWEKVLFVSERSGVVDLAMDPGNRRILYAASWEKERRPWNFIEGGGESAIFKSVDGGQTWKKCVSGFPQGRDTGRIGLAISRSNPAVIYALLDNQAAKTEGKARSGLTIDGVAEMDVDRFLRLPDETLLRFLKENKAPDVYSAAMLKNFVRSGTLSPAFIARMLFADNDRRLNPNIIGAEVYRSDNRGETWRKVNRGYVEDMYFTYGFYFGQIRVAPDDENTVYIMGVSLFASSDGGRTFRKIAGEGKGETFAESLVHRDSHALWIDPGNPRWMLLGTDGGVNLSVDRGATWTKLLGPAISQCYTLAVDSGQPPRVYIGTQDNGVQAAVLPESIMETFDWQMLLGGDGAFVVPVTAEPDIFFAAAQFGALYRCDARVRKISPVQPRSPAEFDPYRFNWLAPALASVHDPHVLLFGANKLLRSAGLGENWEEISPDLTDRRNIDGNVPYGTLTTISESSVRQGLIYAGTDDGNVWLTRDGGRHWRKISQALPSCWVTSLVASRFAPETVWLTMSGRFIGDERPLAFVSENGGLDWEDISSTLPHEPLNTIVEDPLRQGVLYLGSDRGAYISRDNGGSWESLRGDLPTVPVLSLAIHPARRLLFAATFGRGVYALPLSEMHRILDDGK